MKIIFERPPIWAEIIKHFPHVQTTRGVLYCWGDSICNPDRVEVTRSVHAHEEVHSVRQAKMGGPGRWWARYMTDPAFRFDEELPAHIVEYRLQQDDSRHRNERRFYLNQIAERLAGPLYGHLITIEKAKRLLKTGASALQDPTQGESQAA